MVTQKKTIDQLKLEMNSITEHVNQNKQHLNSIMESASTALMKQITNRTNQSSPSYNINYLHTPTISPAPSSDIISGTQLMPTITRPTSQDSTGYRTLLQDSLSPKRLQEDLSHLNNYQKNRLKLLTLLSPVPQNNNVLKQRVMMNSTHILGHPIVV